MVPGQWRGWSWVWSLGRRVAGGGPAAQEVDGGEGGAAKAWGKSQQEGVVEQEERGESEHVGHPRGVCCHLVTPSPPEPCEVSIPSLLLLRRKRKFRENKKYNKGEEAGEWKCWDLNPGLRTWAQLLSRVSLLCHPMDCSPPDPSDHGIFQARILEWVAISFSRGSSQPRD